MKTYHSMGMEVLVTENGIRRHIADAANSELAELIARLLNEHEVSNANNTTKTSNA